MVLAYSARELVSVIGTGVLNFSSTFLFNQGPTEAHASIFTRISS